MAKIRIVGDSSGYVELAAPNAAGNNTLELPSNATKLVGADASNSLNVTGIATFSSGIVVSAGSTSAPSISPSGDSNTGIFFPSADTIVIAEGGVEAVRINSSGNFGLGTNNPQVRLDVRQDSSSTTTMAGIRVQNTNITGDSQSGISFFNYDNFGAKIYTLRTGSPQGVLVFATNNGNGIEESNVIERLRIDSSGRVTMPYQPAFCASNQNGAQPSSNHSVVAFNSTFFNVGNHWDATNKRFNAPVTGTYLFTAHVIPTGLAQNTAFELWIAVNSSTVSTARRFLDRRKKTEADSNTFSVGGSVTIQLAANDWVQLTTTLATYSDETNCKFSGFLVG